MPRALSADLRERVVKVYLEKEGLSIAAVAAKFGVGPASVSRWLRLYRETGSVAARVIGGDRRTVIDDRGLAVLQDLAASCPDAIVADFVDLFDDRTGVRVSRETMGRALRRAGLSRKKKSSDPRSESPPR